MNVKENLQWFLWSVKNNKEKKKSQEKKAVVVLGVSCKSAFAELGGKRGHLRKRLCPKSGIRTEKTSKVHLYGGEKVRGFKQNDMSQDGITSSGPAGTLF